MDTKHLVAALLAVLLVSAGAVAATPGNAQADGHAQADGQAQAEANSSDAANRSDTASEGGFSFDLGLGIELGNDRAAEQQNATENADPEGPDVRADGSVEGEAQGGADGEARDGPSLPNPVPDFVTEIHAKLFGGLGDSVSVGGVVSGIASGH